jgi:hypothetical protein
VELKLRGEHSGVDMESIKAGVEWSEWVSEWLSDWVSERQQASGWSGGGSGAGVHECLPA